MRHVGIREFKDHATAILNADETLVIERHGKPIGFYVPIEAKDRRKGKRSLAKLGRTIDQILKRTGMTEDELVNEIAGKPFGRRS